MVTLGALVILVAVLMVRPSGLFAARRGTARVAVVSARSAAAHLRHRRLVAGVALFLLSERARASSTTSSWRRWRYYFVAIAGLTVLTGLNGQISLGHGALMAVGAYTTAKLLGEDGARAAARGRCCVARRAGDRGRRRRSPGAAAARLRGPVPGRRDARARGRAARAAPTASPTSSAARTG